MKTVLVTGGCGFIGSNFVRLLSVETDWRIVDLDKLTYAGNLANVADTASDRIRFVRGDICDRMLVEGILKEEKPWAVVNFAAESHVDRRSEDTRLNSSHGYISYAVFCLKKKKKQQIIIKKISLVLHTDATL